MTAKIKAAFRYGTLLFVFLNKLYMNLGHNVSKYFVIWFLGPYRLLEKSLCIIGVINHICWKNAQHALRQKRSLCASLYAHRQIRGVGRTLPQVKCVSSFAIIIVFLSRDSCCLSNMKSQKNCFLYLHNLLSHKDCSKAKKPVFMG